MPAMSLGKLRHIFMRNTSRMKGSEDSQSVVLEKSFTVALTVASRGDLVPTPPHAHVRHHSAGQRVMQPSATTRHDSRGQRHPCSPGKVLSGSPLTHPPPGSPKAVNSVCHVGCNVWVRGWLARVVTTGRLLPFVIRNLEPQCLKEEGVDVLA
jgi:hypothetical protein